VAKTKEQKQEALKSLNEKVAKHKALILVDFKGLNVSDMFGLRTKLKKQGGELKVAKKTLIKLALKENKLQIDETILKGEIALVLGYEDEISPAKTVYEAVKGNQPLRILGGFSENEFKDAEYFIALAQLPSRKELLGQLVGSLSAPAGNFVRALQYNIKGLLFVFNAIRETKQ
jgi:large subunit ribosomal protein L10